MFEQDVQCFLSRVPNEKQKSASFAKLFLGIEKSKNWRGGAAAQGARAAQEQRVPDQMWIAPVRRPRCRGGWAAKKIQVVSQDNLCICTFSTAQVPPLHVRVAGRSTRPR